MRDAADSGHAATRSAKSRALQCPIRVPILHQVCQLEELGRLRGRLLDWNRDFFTGNPAAVGRDDLLADCHRALCQIGNAHVHRRGQCDCPHFVSHNAVTQLVHKIIGKAPHAVQRAHHRRRVGRVAIGVQTCSFKHFGISGVPSLMVLVVQLPAFKPNRLQVRERSQCRFSCAVRPATLSSPRLTEVQETK